MVSHVRQKRGAFLRRSNGHPIDPHLVQFDQRTDVLVCPCHGAEFDPARGAAVIAGPAPSPLRSIPVAIDQARGTVVATG